MCIRDRDYRGRLKGFISEQLEKLEHTAVDPAADQAEGDAEDDAQQS